jgi:predicted RNA-binding protein with PUA-like domain
MPRYWLVKSEPDCFSIHDLAKSPKQTTFWDGVRNYQARNFMREMKRGDGVLFYHSSTEPMAVVGAAVVAREAYPDHTARDPKNDHYDPKATIDNPIWEMVDIKFARVFDRPLTITELRGVKALSKMELLRQGSRLSVQPVSEPEWKAILALADLPAAETTRDSKQKKPPKATKSRSTAIRKRAVRSR